MSNSINCAICNIKYIPFVDGQSTMCNECHREYLKSFNISELQNYNIAPKEQKKQPTSLIAPRKNFDPPTSYFQYTLDTPNKEISFEYLSDLEKHHKSLKFHNKFHK